MNWGPPPDHTEAAAATFRTRGYWGRPGVACMLEEHAAEAPGRLAIVDTHGARASYGELAAAVEAAAEWFHDHGLRKGDAALFAMSNEIDYAVAHLAASRVGIVSVMLSAREGAGEVVHAATATAAQVAVLAPAPQLGAWLEALAPLRSTDGSLHHVMVTRLEHEPDARRTADLHGAGAWPGWRRLSRRQVRGRPGVELGGEDVELVVFSSGTTGRPKGIAHTYDGTGASLWNWVRTLGLTWQDPVFCPATFGHVGGSQWGLRTAIATGAPLVTMSRWDPVAAAQLIGEHGCTYTLVTPTYVHDLASQPVSVRRATEQFRYWTVGGSRMEETFVPRAEEALGGVVLRGFGMSEHFMSTITRPDDPADKRATCDGRALPGVQLEAWDGDDQPVPAGTIGEMVYRGPSLIGGYFTDPAETERTFVDGWQRTGDLVVFDRDGFVEIVDRKKEMIIRGGENISPQEVEDVLRGAGMADFAVVPVPEARLGEQVALVVEHTVEVDLPEVRTLLEHAGLATYKWPEVMIVLESLPRTSLGKLQRGVVRRLAAEHVTTDEASA